MLLPDGLATNAYRVLRLSANASSPEIHKAAERARRASALGLPATEDVDSGLLGPVPHSDPDIRAAVSRLGNPGHRLKDRLFWFYHVPGADLADSSAWAFEFAAGDLAEIVRRHDEALRGLFNAFHAKLDDAGAATWVRALRRWHTIVSDDSYWALSAAIENRGGFEPRALSADAQSTRSNAVSFAAHGLLVEGRDAASRTDSTTVLRIMAVLSQLAGTGSWAHAAQDELASLAEGRFSKLCREIREAGGGKLVRERYSAGANKIVTEATLSRFRREVEPELTSLLKSLPPDHDLGRRVRESAARSLYGIAVDFTWADEFICSEALHKEALELAKGTPTAALIESGLTRVEGSARTQRAYSGAKPISAAPSLNTINGFGEKLYGKSDYDSISESYATTHYLVALFVPIFPIARYRVINGGGNSYRFLGKLPLRKGDRWHQAIVVAGVLIWLAISYASSPARDSYSSGTSTYDQSATTDAAPSGPIAATDTARLSDPFSLLIPPSPAEQSPALGATRVIARSDRADLSRLIDNNRIRIREIESQLGSDDADILILTARLNVISSRLEVMRLNNDDGTTTDIEEYNAQADGYNALLRRKRLLVAAFNAKVKDYDDMLSRDKRLVARYNGR